MLPNKHTVTVTSAVDNIQKEKTNYGKKTTEPGLLHIIDSLKTKIKSSCLLMLSLFLLSVFHCNEELEKTLKIFIEKRNIWMKKNKWFPWLHLFHIPYSLLLSELPNSFTSISFLPAAKAKVFSWLKNFHSTSRSAMNTENWWKIECALPWH